MQLDEDYSSSPFLKLEKVGTLAMAQYKKKSNDFRVTSYHIHDAVTGTSVLVEVDGLKILFDLGSFQSQEHDLAKIYQYNYSKSEIPFSELDYVIISHAHADHCALLPILLREEIQFSGRIMCTEASQKLIALNIVDCAFIMSQECKAHNKRAKKMVYPIYTMEQAEQTIPLLQGYSYDDDIPLNGRVSFRFIPNGHLFGSASIYLTYVKDEYTNKHLLFTGDHFIGCKESQKRPFTRTYEQEKLLKPSVVITEATYGGRFHDTGYDIEKELEKIVLASYRRRRVLVIPAFAIARSTQIVYYLKRIFDRHPELSEDEHYPIYMAGKMMKAAHAIIGRDSLKEEFCDPKWFEAYDLFNWGRVQKIDNFQSVEEKLTDNLPKIIIASSGMVTGGYSSFLAEQFVGRQNVDFVFCGYQCEGSVGANLLRETAKPRGQKRKISIQGKEYIVRCNVAGQLSMSGHADQRQLENLIVKQCDGRSLKKVIIIHGSEDAKSKLKEGLENKLNMDKKEILIPKPNHSIKG